MMRLLEHKCDINQAKLVLVPAFCQFLQDQPTRSKHQSVSHHIMLHLTLSDAWGDDHDDSHFHYVASTVREPRNTTKTTIFRYTRYTSFSHTCRELTSSKQELRNSQSDMADKWFHWCGPLQKPLLIILHLVAPSTQIQLMIIRPENEENSKVTSVSFWLQ